MSEAVQRVDELIRDYLLYRGLTNTLKSLDAELKNDKDRGFRTDKILEQLQMFITTYDLLGLKSYWEHLERRVFSHLEYTHAHNVNKLRISVLRLYVVNAIQSNRSDKVNEFFEKMVPEIQSQQEWREWFALPYLKNPDQNSSFALYFSKQWEETLKISLHNFLSIIFQSMPLPILLSFDAEHQRIIELQEENTKSQEQLAKLQDQVAKQQDQISRLQDQVKQLSSADRSESSLSDASDHSNNIPTGDLQSGQLKSALKITSKKSPSPARRLLSSSSSASTAAPTSKLSSSVPQGGVRSAFSALLGPKKTPEQVTLGQTSKGKDGALVGSSGGGSGSVGKKVDFVTNTSNSSTQPQNQAPANAQMRLQQQYVYDQQRKELFSRSQTQTPTQTQTQAQPQPQRSSDKPSQLPHGTSSSSDEQTSLNSPPSKPETGLSSPVNRPRSVSASKKAATNADLFAGEEGMGMFLILSQDEYTEHHSSITHSRFSPSALAVASMDIDGVVKVWKTTPNPVTMTTIMFKSPLLSLEWASKSDRLLILGSSVGSVKLYDCEGKKLVKDMEVDSSYPRVVSVACNPSGTTFVCSSASQVADWGSDLSKPGSPLRGACKLSTWDLKTFRLQNELPLAKSAGCVNCTSFNHNGSLIVTGAGDGMVRLFDIQRHECLLSWRAHQGQVYAAQFSPDETSVYSMGSDGKFTEWSIHKVGHKLRDLPIHDGATGPFVVSGFGGYRQQQNPRGKLFAFDTSGNYVLTCAPHGGVIYKLHKDEGMVRMLTILGHRTPVVSVDWCTSLNTGVCLSGSMDGRVQVTTLLSQ